MTTKSLVVAAMVPLFAGCVAGTTEDVAVSAPPPPRTELFPPSPEPDYVWLAGGWRWHDHWVWEPDRWAAPPRRGAVWVHGSWVKHGDHRVWVESHWM